MVFFNHAKTIVYNKVEKIFCLLAVGQETAYFTIFYRVIGLFV